MSQADNGIDRDLAISHGIRKAQPSDKVSTQIKGIDASFASLKSQVYEHGGQDGMDVISDVERGHAYPRPTRIVACAAASLAIGTRKGEQDT